MSNWQHRYVRDSIQVGRFLEGFCVARRFSPLLQSLVFYLAGPRCG
jgi:hypothetical protein